MSQVEKNRRPEDDADGKGARVEPAGGREGDQAAVHQRQQGQVHRSVKEGDGVQQSGLQGCGQQPGAVREETQDYPADGHNSNTGHPSNTGYGFRKMNDGTQQQQYNHNCCSQVRRLEGNAQQSADQVAGRCTEQEDEQDVFDPLAPAVAIGRDHRRCTAAQIGQPSHGLVQGPEGAEPAAEKTAQQNGQYHG